MNFHPPFTPEIYLRFLESVVSKRHLCAFIRNSPDYHQYGRGHLDAFTRPLSSGCFPSADAVDLHFDLGEIIGALDAGSKARIGGVCRVYLASLYLYLSQIHPRGMSLESVAVRIALENLIDEKETKLFHLFRQFLLWLMELDNAHKNAESYFIRVGYIIANAQLPNYSIPSLHEMRSYLPSGIKDFKSVRLLADDPSFPTSWNGLLQKIEYREQIEPLLGILR